LPATLTALPPLPATPPDNPALPLALSSPPEPAHDMTASAKTLIQRFRSIMATPQQELTQQLLQRLHHHEAVCVTARPARDELID
jgi:hypothetical protein